MELLGIGYLGVEAPDPSAAAAFLVDIVGLMPARAVPGEAFANAATGTPPPPSKGTGTAPDGSVYLKMDDHQWRIALHPGADRRIAYTGFELADAARFSEATAALRARGVEVHEATAPERRARAVRQMAWFTDPAGNRLELFWGPTLDYSFRSPVGAEFRTGRLGLGHVNWLVADLDANLRFYIEVLGFRLRDYTIVGPETGVYFLGCSARHHTVAIGHFGPFDVAHHVLFEVRDIDQVGRALDRVLDAGIELSATLGRHKNDMMLSFYMKTPLGFEIEIGCGGLDVDDATWVVKEFVEGDWWGHRGLTAAAIEEAVR